MSLQKKSLNHPRISVIPCGNDIRVHLKEGRSVVDREKTWELFYAWMHLWEEYISQEFDFCKEKGVDLILSEITPQVFLVAESLGIPGIAVSNFSRDKIYEHPFPGTSEVRLLRDAYLKASYACILPFDIAMDKFPRKKRVSLVSREATISRREMRQRIGIRENNFLVFIGKTSDSYINAVLSVENHSGIRFLLPSGISIPGALNIPPEETESQNWIGMCDCVVTKCKYSAVSEAVRAKVPLLIWKREGFIEDEAIAEKIENFGIGKMVRDVDEGIQYCITHRSEVETFRRQFDRIDPLYEENGIYDILKIIQRMI